MDFFNMLALTKSKERRIIKKSFIKNLNNNKLKEKYDTNICYETRNLSNNYK